MYCVPTVSNIKCAVINAIYLVELQYIECVRHGAIVYFCSFKFGNLGLNNQFRSIFGVRTLKPISHGPLIQLISRGGGYFYVKLEFRTTGPQKLG